MNAQLHQIPDFGTWLTLLSPVGHPDATANSVIQVAAALAAGSDAKVVDSATKMLADLVELVVALVCRAVISLTYYRLNSALPVPPMS